MRPEILNPLFRDVVTLKGVGPRMAKSFEALTGGRLIDLCWHLPSGIIDRSYRPVIAEAADGALATITVTIGQHQQPPNRRLPYKVLCHDDSGGMSLVFFHARSDYLLRTLPEGESRIVSGRINHYGDEIQMTHPDHMVAPEAEAEIPQVEPVYPLTGGLTAKPLRRAIEGALACAPDLPEWQDQAFLARQSSLTWQQALNDCHHPTSGKDIEPDFPARRRLAYDELLANQLALALVRRHIHRQPGHAIAGDGHLQKLVLEALPYQLTEAQRRSGEEIAGDMADEGRMLRLLQGDVGSGKTVVALLAMLNAVEAGGQAVLMAPTEILARQHLATLTPLCEAAGVEIGLLTGRDKGAGRKETLSRLADGSIRIAIGTHALFQDDVEFANLTMAVIDEQHRFGVDQRLLLSGKGQRLDMLVMTATPIPRTLTLTVYGDMDLSILDEKPPGREPVDTRVVPLARLDETSDGLARALKTGARVFWVCPLVEESELLPVTSAEDRYAMLKARFGDVVGLVHGRMKAAQKDQVMADFAEGRLSILVATTVIEVGVDVPDATIMVVEHAERFGLAQLHQLRGRIGRGGRKGTCLLLYGGDLSETARARLKILRETEDGFRIAEEDLRLRGAGDLLGTKQSGLPAFHLADLAAHQDLMLAARDDARLILNDDPDLEGERGQALRTLLYLFERDAAIRYLRSG